MNSFGELAKTIFEQYRKELMQNGFEETRRLRYAYGSFSNGEPVEPFVRRYFRDRVPPNTSDPFTIDEAGSAYALLAESAPEPLLCGYAYAMLKGRDDLRQQYPHVPGEDTEAFARWFVRVGERVYDVPRVFIEAQQRLIDQADEHAPSAKDRSPWRWS